MCPSTHPSIATEPSAYSPGRVLFPLGLGTALSLMGDATLYTVLPTHMAEAGVVLSEVGIILGVNRAIRVFLNGPAGIVYDKSPRRWLFVSALFVGALSTTVYAATKGFWPLLVGRLLWGLAWSGIWVGGATVIMDVTTLSDRGRWSGLYQTWFFLGAALGAFAGGLLTDRIGYTKTMWVGAMLTALGGLTAVALLPETRPVLSANPIMISPTDPASSDARRDRSKLHVQRGLWIAAFLHGINRFVIAGVLYATIGLLVQDRLPFNALGLGVATVTGILIAGRTVFSMASAPLAGAASDWLGSRWGVVRWSLAIGALSLSLITLRSPVAILIGIALGAMISASVQTLVIALAGDLAGQTQRGRAIGLVHTVGDVGSATGPPVAYFLLPTVGLDGVYWLCAGLFVVGFFVLWRLNAGGD